MPLISAMLPGQVQPVRRLRHSACRRPRAGLAAAEFGLIFPIFFAAVLGIAELGWQLTIGATLDRATLRAGRFGTTGQPAPPGAPGGMGCRSQSIPWLIAQSTGNVLRPERLVVSMASVGSASELGAPSVAGPGLGGQVVTYDVAYTEPFITLAWLRLVGGPDRIVHRATVMVKNEAFDNASC